MAIECFILGYSFSPAMKAMDTLVPVLVITGKIFVSYVVTWLGSFYVLTFSS